MIWLTWQISSGCEILDPFACSTRIRYARRTLSICSEAMQQLTLVILLCKFKSDSFLQKKRKTKCFRKKDQTLFHLLLHLKLRVVWGSSTTQIGLFVSAWKECPKLGLHVYHFLQFPISPFWGAKLHHLQKVSISLSKSQSLGIKHLHGDQVSKTYLLCSLLILHHPDPAQPMALSSPPPDLRVQPPQCNMATHKQKTHTLWLRRLGSKA